MKNEPIELIVESIDLANDSQTLTFGDDSDDEFYDPAYDYAMDELGYDEDNSDLFANIVMSFFTLYFDGFGDEDEEYTVCDLMKQAVDAVDDFSKENGYNISTEELVNDVKDYISAGFELEECDDEEEDGDEDDDE